MECSTDVNLPQITSVANETISLLFMICLLPTVHLYEPFKKNSQRSCNVLQHCRQLETQNKLRYLEFEKVAAAVVGILKIIIRIQFVEI